MYMNDQKVAALVEFNRRGEIPLQLNLIRGKFRDLKMGN
jgi:hypothetical protein